MIVLHRKKYGWRIKEIWFSRPFVPDTSGDLVLFRQCAQDLPEPGRIGKRPFHTLLIDLQSDPGRIWQNFNQQTRRHIRRAERLGLQYHVNEAPDRFFQLLNTFIKSRGFTRPVKRSRFDELLPHGDLFTVSQDDELLCGHFCLRDAGRARYLWGASTRLENGNDRTVAAANRWLFWQEFQYYQNRDTACYDLGGVDPHPDSSAAGIAQFKKGFGGEPVQEYHYLLVNNRCLKLLRTFLVHAL